jgi:proliferating cell nuclear antigen
MTDTHRILCIDIALHAENFDQFSVSLPSSESKIQFGINLAHLKKMLKPVKKKESIEFIKDSENNDELCIKISPKDSIGKTTMSYIKIQEIQIIDLSLPEGYDDYVSIPASDYQKMCKDMDSISQDIEIRATKTSIRFTSDMTGIYSRSILFGATDDDDDDEVYLQHFESEQLNNLGRISGLGVTPSSNIQVYTKKDMPILFKTNVGTLGKINIYIKSKEQTECEAQAESA